MLPKKTISENDLRILDLQNKFKKIIFIIESKEERNNRLKYEFEKKINSKIENIDDINNCGSLYIQDFDIKFLKTEENKQKCEFKTIKDKINPFLTEKYDLKVKRFIDLKNIENSQKNLNTFLGIDNIDDID